MSVAGKKKDEWVAQTLCDFGTPGRRESIRHHFSIESAIRAFDGLCKIYGRGQERCWQEDKYGELINDSTPTR